MRTPRPWILPAQPTTRNALRAAGVTDAMLRTQLTAGHLSRLRPAVYIASGAAGEPAAQHLLLARAEQLIHPDAVVSHASAAVNWAFPHPGVGDWLSGGVHLTSIAGSRPSRPGFTHHHGPLPERQVSREVEGWLVTSPARTAIDLADGLSLPEALVLLDWAARRACEGFVPQIRRSDYRNPRLAEAARSLLSDAAAEVRCRRLEPAIALAEPCRESAIESLSAGHFHLAGLPAPLYQPPVRTPFGTFYPDFLWPTFRLIGEADGAVKYSDAAAVVKEKEREQILRDLGFRVVRWLGKEIMTRPDLVVDRVARELGAS